ncbi:hypothetical protein KL86PLE_40115 [uncultured Pleomorphomonas sp.]|uniref:Uncharacterized protein n=1 Tax=uncultured Pleomorphomonas sp. TaxID=442121 RepID=A0A212LFQ7_9HYPH|nr:hypothetical protein KL86PLE_40115 [uncultured Pleomorphomonas sp.]
MALAGSISPTGDSSSRRTRSAWDCVARRKGDTVSTADAKRLALNFILNPSGWFENGPFGPVGMPAVIARIFHPKLHSSPDAYGSQDIFSYSLILLILGK